MKKILLLIFIFTGIIGHAQNSTDEQSIKNVILQFFQSLEQKDTNLLKSTLDLDGQIWSMRKQDGLQKAAMRFFYDDKNRLHSLPSVKEEAISFDIKIHKNIASAWVPYKFIINGQFSHCGIDVFSLMKLDGSWKIVNLAYTVETEDCEDLNKN